MPAPMGAIVFVTLEEELIALGILFTLQAEQCSGPNKALLR